MKFCCPDCNQTPLVVSAERAPRRDVSNFTPRERESYELNYRLRDVEVSFHEAAHVVGAALFGIRTEHAQAGLSAHVRFGAFSQPATEASLIIPTLAGNIGGAIGARRMCVLTNNEMAGYIRAVRTGHEGSCDHCQIAGRLAWIHWDKQPTEIAAIWHAHWKRCLSGFDHLGVNCQMRMLAKALRERVHLTADAIESVVDYPYLRSLRHLVDPEAERNDLPVNISNQGVFQ